jgi:hypothetical protein
MASFEGARAQGYMNPAQLSLPEALEVSGHLARQRKVARIEAFNLIDAGARILGQVEDVHLTMAQNNSHADCGVPEAVDTAIGVGHEIVF